MEADELPKKREAPGSSEYDIIVISCLSDQNSFAADSEIMLPINNILPKIQNQGPNIIFLEASHSVKPLIKEAKRNGSIISRGNSYLNPPTLKEMITMFEPTLDYLRPLHKQVKEKYECLIKLENSAKIIKSSVLESTKENLTQFKNLKTSCEQDILRIYRKLYEALHCLASPRSEVNMIENSYENCVVLMLFCFCYFCLVHLNFTSIFKYYNLLSLLTDDGEVEYFINKFDQMSPVVKIMILDCWLQLFYINDQFKNPDEVLRYLYSLNRSFPIEYLSESTSDLFLSIFNSKIIKTYYKVVDELRYFQIIRRILSYVHCLDLPQSFHGLTSFGRYILISKSKTMNISSSSLILGYQLLVVLHESAHFMLREDLGTDKDWIEFSNPNKGGKKPEAGRYLEEGIFGYVPGEITIKGAEYLLHVSNWELKLQTFRRGFTINNKRVAGRSNSPTDPGHITLMHFSNSSFITLGQCAKE